VKTNSLPSWSGKVKPKLRVLFGSRGITKCELKLSGECDNWNVQFAHSKKRWKIETIQDLQEVAVACSACHEKIEARHADMDAIIKDRIKSRPVVIPTLTLEELLQDNDTFRIRSASFEIYEP